MMPRRGSPLVTAVDTVAGFGEFGWRERFVAVRRRRADDDALPQLALQIGRAVRNGRPLEQALGEVASIGHRGAVDVHREVAAGRPLNDALHDWLGRAESDAEHLLVSALWLGNDIGGNVARSLDIVGDGIRDDLQLAARRRTLLTQSRLSVAVLVALPVVFAVIASVVQGSIIYRGWMGLAMVLAGGSLDVMGLWWFRRLLRSLR